MIENFTSRLQFLEELPAATGFSEGTIVIYDQGLNDHCPEFSQWVKSFERCYPVKAGEELKRLSHFHEHMENILALAEGVSRQDLAVLAIGGGTVGDFAGFVASVLKRGVPLVQIPSTWLSAIDSAHGGKTGLNSNFAKNQVGTFYPAEEIYVVSSLLINQPAERYVDGLAEMLKMAIISGGHWSEELMQSDLQGADLVLQFLKPAIEAKWQVVEKDPLEKTGLRRSLNLGHTLGHVIELHHKLSHGQAVGLGLHFAIEWSKERDILSDEGFQKTHQLLEKHLPREILLKKELGDVMSSDTFFKIAAQDKKMSGDGTVYFEFIKKVGEVFEQKVTINEFYQEAKRQGWVQ